MNMERNEKSEKIYFDVEPSRVDRKLGHVYIPHNGRTYKWFLDLDERIILLNGLEHELSAPICAAMKAKVRAILSPELAKK